MGKDRIRIAARITAALRGFRRSEDGSLLPFGMMLLLLMLMVGGLAIDVMRHEQKRVTLQQTLDRSVLAAAGLNQSLDPETVVRDYFDKVDLSQYLKSVTVESGFNFRSVTADAEADTHPMFMQMMGVNSFDVAADSGAEQRINNVEVSLVLDISGSMSGTRINALRPAARSFIDTVFANSEAGRTTVSIIPYNAQVNLGPDLMAQFNVPKLHDYSYCVELPDDVFGTTTLSRTRSFVQNGHFDPFNGTSSTAQDYNCPPETGNRIVMLSDNTTTLKDAITNLQVGGNTSIDLGVKWGALLLDPATQAVTQGMIARGKVAAQYANRPLDIVSGNTIKVLVVMTDGENTTEYKLTSNYRSGLSNIYRRNSNGRASMYYNRSGSNDYYWVSDGSWHSSPEGGTSGATQLTWPEVFRYWSVQYVAYQLMARPLGGNYSTYYYDMVDYVSSTKNSRLQQVCTAAKNSGIIIYGIAFEAPSNGRAQIQACATSDAHYFAATNLDIASVFHSIASQLSYLRLTQ